MWTALSCSKIPKTRDLSLHQWTTISVSYHMEWIYRNLSFQQCQMYLCLSINEMAFLENGAKIKVEHCHVSRKLHINLSW